jgi:hypothetical protein
MKLTLRQQETLKWLKGKDFTPPTEIGHLFGGHSSIGSPICLSLVKLGLLERSPKGYYKIKE